LSWFVTKSSNEPRPPQVTQVQFRPCREPVTHRYITRMPVSHETGAFEHST
jgi:hypothetical protein